jgi:lipopolysaccharide export system protein LptC
MSSSTTMTAARRAPQAPPAARRDDSAYENARRHSRRVRWLKALLPAAAILGLLGFVGWSYLSVPSIEGVSVGGAAFTDGKLVMANPKLDGHTKDNLPYTMTAARAIQDASQTGKIMLEEIDAKLPIDAKNTANVIAASGIYDNENNTLKIDSAIKLTTTDGMVANLRSADVNMATGTMTTQDPVKISMNRTLIEADTMNVTDNGKVMVFERRVRVNIAPETGAKSEAKSGDTYAAQ